MPPKKEPVYSLGELINVLIDKKLIDTHTAIPAIVESFDATTQTAKVNLAIPRIREVIDKAGVIDEQTWNVAPIFNVPVQFPSAGGFHITFPVSNGDECLIVFSERSIDAWQQYGGVQKQTDRRVHDYTDAIAILGIHSSPNSVPDYSTNSLQIRNNDASTYINVTNDTVEINGSTFGGLIKIDELTAKLNALEAEIALHVHTANNTASVTVYTPFISDEYENDTVIH